MIRLNYTFDDISFTYELDTDAAVDYIKRVYTDDELINDFIEYVYPHLSKQDKEMLDNDYGFDGTPESIKFMSDEDLDNFMSQQVIDSLLDSDIYNPELEDYFEDEAYAEFNEGNPEDEWRADYNRERL